MARKKSLWSELQRELERRQRASLAHERQEQQVIRQLTREQEQADRRAARADAAERKRQEQLAHDAGAAMAAAMKGQLDSRLTELKTILTSALPAPPRLPFAMLKRTVQPPPFDPGALGEPSPAPAWEDFAPPAPGMLSVLTGGKARHARAVEDSRQAHQHALAEHRRSEDRRIRQLRAAREEHAQKVKTLEAEC
jgi:restriction system protein